MQVSHRASVATGLVLNYEGLAYASTGVHGVKRQRLLTTAQAKSRRRSTQGIVAKPEPKPEPPPGEKPEWVRHMEEDAVRDEGIAELLKGANGDPKVIEKRLKDRQDGKRSSWINSNTGEHEQMGVEFRDVDPFNLWVWFELYRPLSGREAEELEEVLASWFMLGRLGAYNSQNLQVFYKAAEDTSYLDYEKDELETSMHAFMHDMTQLEVRDRWARCWVNLGTADELALDMLINALSNLSRENVGIRKVYFGGEHEDWPTPEVDLPTATMDPMRGPRNMDAYD